MVVDPVQSVKGKVVTDAFHLTNPQVMMLGQEPGQTNLDVGRLNKPSIQVGSVNGVSSIFCDYYLISCYFFMQALIHGLNRHYYSIEINYRKNELEEKMLLHFNKKEWTDVLTLHRFDTHSKTNEQIAQVKLSFFAPMSLDPGIAFFFGHDRVLI